LHENQKGFQISNEDLKIIRKIWNSWRVDDVPIFPLLKDVKKAMDRAEETTRQIKDESKFGEANLGGFNPEIHFSFFPVMEKAASSDFIDKISDEDLMKFSQMNPEFEKSFGGKSAKEVREVMKAAMGMFKPESLEQRSKKSIGPGIENYPLTKPVRNGGRVCIFG
jgi:hypothetical protein